MRMDEGLFRQLGFYWDALDNRWKQWVIGYDTDLQRQLLSAFLQRNVQFGDIVVLMVVGAGLAVLVISLFIFRPLRRGEQDPYQRLYQRFCRKLARRGLPREPHEGPLSYAEKAARAYPGQQDQIRLLTRLYINARYRSRPSERQLRRMRELLRGLRLPSRA